jgi:ketopantoate reductase
MAGVFACKIRAVTPLEDRMIGIVGTGSMGAALGWSLSKLGFDFYFIGRKGPVEHSFVFNADGIHKNITAPLPQDLTNTALLFFCVKSYDLTSAIKHLAMFSKKVVAVSLVNGAVDQLLASAQQTYNQHVFRPGFSTVAVNQSKNGDFTLRSSKGEFQFGPLRSGDQQTALETKLTSFGTSFIWNTRIQIYQHRKWLFNTVINTLTACKKLSCNGDLLSDLPTLTGVFEEAYRLGEEIWGKWGFEKSDMFAAMLKLIDDTATNENSMAADVRLGRRTESLHLAGLTAGKDKSCYPLLISMHAQLEQ